MDNTHEDDELQNQFEHLFDSYLMLPWREQRRVQKDVTERLQFIFSQISRDAKELSASMGVLEEEDDSVHLQKYLDIICGSLSEMPLTRMLDIRCEIRQHLYTMIAAEITTGTSEAEAITISLQRFGSPYEIRNALQKMWRRDQLAQLSLSQRVIYLIKSSGEKATSIILFVAALFISETCTRGASPVLALIFGLMMSVFSSTLQNIAGLRKNGIISDAPLASSEQSETITPNKLRKIQKAMKGFRLAHAAAIGIIGIGIWLILTRSYHAAYEQSHITFWIGWLIGRNMPLFNNPQRSRIAS